MENATATTDPLHSASPSAAPHPRLAPYKYPIYDLDSSIEVAEKIHVRSGGAASQIELAQYLGYSGIRNGSFVSRVAAARLFGLIEGPTSRITLTPRAIAILQPDYEATEMRARLDAFCAVPLFNAFLREYEGKPLPPSLGIQNALQTKFGVQEKQAQAVADRLLESAEQAGLFRVAGARTKMIVPTFGESQQRFDEPPARLDAHDIGRTPNRSGNGSGNNGGGGGRRDTGGRSFPTLVAGALEELPDEPGEPGWDESDMKEWLDLFERVLRRVYKVRRGSHADDDR